MEPIDVKAMHVRVPKAAELIAARMRRAIVVDEFVEGQLLPSESTLMEQFDVSRPTLREAYRILESEGLITVRRGARGGASVHKPTAETAARYAALVLQSERVLLRDIYDTRMLLEGPVIQLVHQNPDADLSILRLINEEAAENESDLLASLDHHHSFHNALLEMTGNRTLVLLSRMIDLILEEADVRHVTDRAAVQDEAAASRTAHRTHVRILDLLEEGSVEAADQLWRAHLADSAAWVLTHARAETALEFLV